MLLNKLCSKYKEFYTTYERLYAYYFPNMGRLMREEIKSRNYIALLNRQSN
jgi:hypothetical protein